MAAIEQASGVGITPTLKRNTATYRNPVSREKHGLPTDPELFPLIPIEGRASVVRQTTQLSNGLKQRHPRNVSERVRTICTAYYFLHFLVLLPVLGKLEKPLPLPESISRPAVRRAPPAGPGGGPLPQGATAKQMGRP